MTVGDGRNQGMRGLAAMLVALAVVMSGGPAGAEPNVAQSEPPAATEAPAKPEKSAKPTKLFRLTVKPSSLRSETVIFTFRGKIAAPLAEEIEREFERYKAGVSRIKFNLDSGGGSVKEGKKVIEVLQRIKRSHKLDTFVNAGHKCGSMCVFLYAQGQRRYAATASLWLFHEVSYSNRTTNKVTRLDRGKWLELLDVYLAPAGVSPAWLAELKTHAVGSDYWRTGEALVREGSGLVHKTTSDEIKRTITPVAQQPGMASR